jgi:hypothetical protein
MRQRAAFTLAPVLGVAAALTLASCGEKDAKLLPGTTAQEITENLDAVKQQADEGECAGAAEAAQEVSSQVAALTDVDPKLRQALERGTGRLNEVVATCEEADTETIAPPEETTGEEDEELPPGQEKKEEKEQEHEEKEAEKEVEKAEKEAERAEKEEEAPPPPPPSEDGGTGAPGGVSPAAPAPEDEGEG